MPAETRHLLSLEKLTPETMRQMLTATVALKHERGRTTAHPLDGQIWALIFSKSSTRTRVSFEVGIRELGGQVMFLNANDIQLGRGEMIKDTARVLGRMIHGAVIRTFAQQDVEEFATFAGVPTINALTDEEHPCQILADVFTFEEKRGPIAGRKVAFLGDAACNVANSWIWASVKLGFDLRLAAPKPYRPDAKLLRRAGGHVRCVEHPVEAVSGADLLYTDVWVSMGKEAEATERLRRLKGYQLNPDLVRHANPDALIMHCLPAYRGQEIDAATFEANASTIFDQAENRLHLQKAVLCWVVGRD